MLEQVWDKQPKGWTFVCMKDGAHWTEHPYGGEVGWVDGSVRQDRDVYFCPNTFSEPRRRKEYMLPSRWLYADLDKTDPFTLDENLGPTIAWSSSPLRYQALWLLPMALDVHQHEVLNKKLTYMVGADRSGWDATQVLRVPGSLNHKYPQKPLVRLLWNDLPDAEMHGRKWKDIQKYELPSRHMDEPLRGELSLGLQAKLRATEATGDRSKVLWRMERELLEHGYTQDQVFWVLRGTVWNKFTDEQLRAEIGRADI